MFYLYGKKIGNYCQLSIGDAFIMNLSNWH